MLVDGVRTKLKTLAGDLGKWGSETFGSVRREIKSLKRGLEVMLGIPSRVGPSHRGIKILDRLVELFHREEIMWRQRSQVDWLKHGDKTQKNIIKEQV
jgi:hypothetical protein